MVAEMIEDGNKDMAGWITNTIEWSPLHHLDVLSPDRTRLLLRQGADVHAKPTTGDTRTPFEVAEGMQGTSESARLVLLAAGQWSVESHSLFPNAARNSAATLAFSLYHMYARRMNNGGWTAVDFARYILAFTVSR